MNPRILLLVVLLSLAGWTLPSAHAFRYGNWCGVGNNGKKPVDAVDALCKRHDECCHRNGPLQFKIATMCSCRCDRQLIQHLKVAGRKSGTRKARIAASRISKLVYLSFCHCGTTKLCVPWVSCSRKRVCTRKLGKKLCIKKLVCKKTKKCKQVARLGHKGKCLKGKALLKALKKHGLLKKYGLSR